MKTNILTCKHKTLWVAFIWAGPLRTIVEGFSGDWAWSSQPLRWNNINCKISWKVSNYLTSNKQALKHKHNIWNKRATAANMNMNADLLQNWSQKFWARNMTKSSGKCYISFGILGNSLFISTQCSSLSKNWRCNKLWDCIWRYFIN